MKTWTLKAARFAALLLAIVVPGAAASRNASTQDIDGAQSNSSPARIVHVKREE